MKKSTSLLLLVLVTALIATAVIGQVQAALPAGGAYMVDVNGVEMLEEDPANEWKTGGYAYIKLYEDNSTAFANMQETDEVWVDLNGYDLTVGGSGTLYVLDSANDMYDKSKCGTVTNTGNVKVQTDATNPNNGNRYLAVAAGNTYTFHRLNMRFTFVSIRTARMGLYYKAAYQCDDTIAKMVHSYGVILSLYDMPGADFAAETDQVNKATALTPDANFGDGTEATSCEVAGIMQKTQPSLINARNGKMKIYANPYIRLHSADGPVIVGDTDNVGKTAEDPDFSGCAYSLQSAMEAFDRNYGSFSEEERTDMEQFWTVWKDRGMHWPFTYIGKLDVVDNSPLELVNNKAFCPACKRNVTWKKLESSDACLRLSDGDHYYLADDEVTLSVSTVAANGDSVSAAIIAPGRNSKACVHLNGHNLTATNNAVFYGSYGTLNIMGNGIVTGNRNQTGYGDAVHINNSLGGVVNLWGGDYRKGVTGTGARGYVLATATAGGTFNIYQDVKVQGSSNFDSIRIAMSSGTADAPDDTRDNSVVILNGVDMSDATIVFNNPTEVRFKDAILKLVDAKVGTIKMNYCDTVELWGKSQVTDIQMSKDAKVTLGELEAGASIGITADGAFTQESDKAQEYQQYFHPANSYCVLELRDNVLYCIKEYEKELPLTGNTAPCLVCQKNVTWIALVAGEKLTAGGHYYLTGHINYNGATAAVQVPDSGKACLHLNGYNLTATAAEAILGSAGTLNVMGTGTVTGYTASANQGGAVYFDTDNDLDGGIVNLYSGIYQQANSMNANAYTVAVPATGGTVNIYENAEIRSNITGKAIRIADTGSKVMAGANLYGTKVTGDVYLEGSSYGAEASVLTVDNTTVRGDVLVNGVNQITLDHAPVIDNLELTGETELTLGRLSEGTDITVRADGKFTVENPFAAKYAAYFTPASKAAAVTVENNILIYRINYEEPLRFTQGNTAFCRHCERDVQWTELVKNADGTMKILDPNGHYYLAADQVFTSTDLKNSYAFVKAPNSGAACLHLNGHKLHATNVAVIYGNSGVLNVLGAGEVAGFAGSDNVGAAVQTNNGTAGNGINLYSGTYTRYTGASSNSAVVAVRNAGTINIYRQANVNGGTGTAIYLGALDDAKAEVNLDSCVVNGNIVTREVTDASAYKDSILNTLDTTIHGTVYIKGTNNVVTFTGKTVIDLLDVAEGLKVTFAEMLEGSSVKVNAVDVFTPVLEEADHYAPYFSTDLAGKWVVCRNYQLVVRDKTTLDDMQASQGDEAQLESLYTGRNPFYGDLHNHSKSSVYSDGRKTLDLWLQHMEQKRIDFAAILDHRQSLHMYLDEWDDACFVGGSEPGATLTDSKADIAKLDFAMVFADVAEFEKHLKAFEEFCFEDSSAISGDPTKRFISSKYTVERFREIVQSVLDHGGFFTHVHPKLNSYMTSDDPEDYWFVDGTGIEVGTMEAGSKDMNSRDNVEAYELWVDLLERDHRVFATLGDDSHELTDIFSLNTIYAPADDKQVKLEPEMIVERLRAGDLTAGPVGIRMSVGETATGGVTSFDGGRLVFSVGDIHELVYDADHVYCVELYDDGGLIFSAELENPGEQTNYFAMDTDNDQKFYRAVVVDLTDDRPIAVGNPIWNSRFYTMPQ